MPARKKRADPFECISASDVSHVHSILFYLRLAFTTWKTKAKLPFMASISRCNFIYAYGNFHTVFTFSFEEFNVVYKITVGLPIVVYRQTLNWAKQPAPRSRSK